MTGTALTYSVDQACCPDVNDWTMPNLRRFETIPACNYGIVALRGQVVVYETDALHFEDVIDGGFYVVERQRPAACLPYDRWLQLEMTSSDERRCAGPRSRLITTREVVQTIRCTRNPANWWLRLPGGFRDGPLYDWAIALDIVGKVAGLFIPKTSRSDG